MLRDEMRLDSFVYVCDTPAAWGHCRGVGVNRRGTGWEELNLIWVGHREACVRIYSRLLKHEDLSGGDGGIIKKTMKHRRGSVTVKLEDV